MSKECGYCFCDVEEFGYKCNHTEKIYCERECVYKDLEVEDAERVPFTTCSVCGEMLEPTVYETYKADGEFFCCTECVYEYFGIKFTVMED